MASAKKIEPHHVTAKQKRGEMPCVLVFREKRDDGTWVSKVWQAKSRSTVRTSFLNHLGETSYKPRIPWPAEAEQYVLNNYHTQSKRLIAQHLAHTYKMKFTKNAVIKKYHTLTKGRSE